MASGGQNILRLFFEITLTLEPVSNGPGKVPPATTVLHLLVKMSAESAYKEGERTSALIHQERFERLRS
jgi:hypothetical protein